MARGGVGIALAAKVFSLQKRGGNFTPDVMRSARLVIQGKGTKQDINNLRQALGIQRSGATAARRELRNISSVVDRAGSYGVLAATAMQGGASGFAAAGSLANNALFDAEKIVKSKAFKDAIENAAEKYLGNAATGTRAAYGLARGLRGLRVAGAYAAAGAAITVGGIRGVEEFTGVTQSEAARVAASESRIADSNSRASRLEKTIAKQRALNERGLLRKASEEGVGGIWNSFTGADRKKLADMELKDAAKKAGFGNSEQITSLARDRMLREKYGEKLGSMARGLDNKMGTNFFLNPTEVAEKGQQMIGRAMDLRNRIEEAVKIADVKMANRLIEEAEKEIPGQVWRTPGTLWKEQETSRMATRLWSLQNMARAASRTGD